MRPDAWQSYGIPLFDRVPPARARRRRLRLVVVVRRLWPRRGPGGAAGAVSLTRVPPWERGQHGASGSGPRCAGVVLVLKLAVGGTWW